MKPSNPSAANLTVKVVQGFLVFIVLHKLSPEIDFSGIKPVGPCLFPYSYATLVRENTVVLGYTIAQRVIFVPVLAMY